MYIVFSDVKQVTWDPQIKQFKKMKDLNSVQKFYKDKTIFITGASGFMGKVLIEKLLYSCSDVKELIILMRAKRGKTAKQRVEEFGKLPVSGFVMELCKLRIINKGNFRY